MSDSSGAGSRGGIQGWMVGVAWGACAIIFYAGFGRWLGLAVEGIDLALLSKIPLAISAIAFVAAIAVTVSWARRIGGGAASGGELVKGLGRRRFLAGAAASIGGIVATGAAALGRNLGWMTITGPNIQVKVPTSAEHARKEWKGAHIQSYRKLGSTGFEVSDISLGSGRIKGEVGEQVAREAIERGINYFDTAPDYSETGSELALGRAIQGRRDQMFLATKFCTPHGHLPTGTPVADYMRVVEESLKRLQTDHVDLVHIHSCNTIERLMDENAHEAFDRLKQQGKVRFLGFSSHTPNLEAVASKAVESRAFDVMMLAYHHGAWPHLAEIIDRAHAMTWASLR